MSISSTGASALFAPISATTSTQLPSDTLEQFGGTGSFNFFDRVESVEDVVNIFGQVEEQTFFQPEPSNNNDVPPVDETGTDLQQILNSDGSLGNNVNIFA